MTATVGGVTIAYGNFIQSVVDFLLIAFSVFIAVKLINNARSRSPPEFLAEARPSELNWLRNQRSSERDSINSKYFSEHMSTRRRPAPRGSPCI
jgi:large-conductance mechanosensitive channel